MGEIPTPCSEGKLGNDLHFLHDVPYTTVDLLRERLLSVAGVIVGKSASLKVVAKSLSGIGG